MSPRTGAAPTATSPAVATPRIELRFLHTRTFVVRYTDFVNGSGMQLNSTNINSPSDEYSCEDGFLFHGQRGGIHLLCHCNGVYGYPWCVCARACVCVCVCGTAPSPSHFLNKTLVPLWLRDDHGRVAFSRDGITWRWSVVATPLNDSIFLPTLILHLSRWSKERTFPPALTHPDGTVYIQRCRFTVSLCVFLRPATLLAVI